MATLINTAPAKMSNIITSGGFTYAENEYSEDLKLNVDKLNLGKLS